MTSGPDTTGGRTAALADGHEIPLLGFGVWQVADGDECANAVRWALDLGYRHIDTAQAYGNEESVGHALRESGIPREDVYITTKFFPRSEDAAAEVEQSLKRLGLDYVDLYLVHWHQGGAVKAWAGMERAHKKGHARSIGISNFSAAQVEELLAVADVPPVVNQVQFSPFEYRRGLLDACDGHHIVVEAYSPLGTGRHLDDKTVGAIAERVGRTPAQVLLRWALQQGLVVLPKSTHRERIEENGQIFDFQLSDEDMGELNGLDQTQGTEGARERPWW